MGATTIRKRVKCTHSATKVFISWDLGIYCTRYNPDKSKCSPHYHPFVRAQNPQTLNPVSEFNLGA